MSNQSFDKNTKILLCIMITIGFILIGFGVGILLSCKTAATLISSGIGLLISSILLVRLKYFEIEN